jgi:coenzyme F420-0:L-glutamate ligase/coenzyme F420-1:gamma-L-glutamate ligase
MIEIVELGGIGEIGVGDDLAAILGDAIERCASPLRDGDVLVVTQKIVSKAEGRQVNLEEVEPGEPARELSQLTRKDPRMVQLVLDESSEIVRAVPEVLITRHKLGHVMANAGIDRSNIGPSQGARALLLPLDPDATAANLHSALGVPVVISDSFGRPWRLGVVCVAIGAAGLPALHDRRGELDRDDRPLEVTQVALADMIASAAGLVSGEGAEGIPAVLVRGCRLDGTPRKAAELVRPRREDLFA